MSGQPPKKTDTAQPSSGVSDPVPRSGSGADTALFAMLRKRQMRAGAEPQVPQPDARKTRKK